MTNQGMTGKGKQSICACTTAYLVDSQRRGIKRQEKFLRWQVEFLTLKRNIYDLDDETALFTSVNVIGHNF
jgi:hypothetical protein